MQCVHRHFYLKSAWLIITITSSFSFSFIYYFYWHSKCGHTQIFWLSASGNGPTVQLLPVKLGGEVGDTWYLYMAAQRKIRNMRDSVLPIFTFTVFFFSYWKTNFARCVYSLIVATAAQTLCLWVSDGYWSLDHFIIIWFAIWKFSNWKLLPVLFSCACVSLSLWWSPSPHP